MENTSTVRRARHDEAPTLALLGEALFRESYGPTHPEPELSRYVARTFSSEVFERVLSDGSEIVLVVEDEPSGPLIGYAVLRDGPPPGGHLADDETDPIEILRFYVDPRWHGSGIAQGLMSQCVLEAKSRGRDVIWLQAWQEAARALAFYGKMGFVVRGAAKFEFGDRMDDDFLLVRRV